ncbi:hypothetical protein CLV60_106210 [Dyadobacter jiangsuensis]|uniref:Uncharacterized protein n=1 Tax=Dyadobacter jiangsuensis TaxID=1591085 RepID=A0A2P8G3S3_9BACT|nr:hypothetical protein CLV60_106210 [Dyadobacter jiangsuensis]
MAAFAKADAAISFYLLLTFINFFYMLRGK